jgi:hypothetical protein
VGCEPQRKPGLPGAGSAVPELSARGGATAGKKVRPRWTIEPLGFGIGRQGLRGHGANRLGGSSELEVRIKHSTLGALVRGTIGAGSSKAAAALEPEVGARARK